MTYIRVIPFYFEMGPFISIYIYRSWRVWTWDNNLQGLHIINFVHQMESILNGCSCCGTQEYSKALEEEEVTLRFGVMRWCSVPIILLWENPWGTYVAN